MELKGLRIEALLKECLWMGESDGSSEGGQDEASQQPKLQHPWCTAAKTYEKVLSNFFL